MIFPPKPSYKDGIKIITVYGAGWKDVYKVEKNGMKTLIYSDTETKKELNDSTSVDVWEEMPWSEFCKKYKNPR